jgi:hypothetical protein
MRSNGSTSSLGSRPRSSPLAVPPPFLAPDIDSFGRPSQKLRLADHDKPWDQRHQLQFHQRTGNIFMNDFAPQGSRVYFSKPHSLEEVKEHVATTPNGRSLLRSMSLPEPSSPKSVITADVVSPSNCPGRHQVGGEMLDRDQRVRPWNNRWHRSVAQLNEHMHKAHRTYFVQPSPYETSKSQEWRRFTCQEASTGEWIPLAQKKKPHFESFGAKFDNYWNKDVTSPSKATLKGSFYRDLQ